MTNQEVRVWALYSSGDGYCDCGNDARSLISVTADESVAVAWEAEGHWQEAVQTVLTGMSA